MILQKNGFPCRIGLPASPQWSSPFGNFCGRENGKNRSGGNVFGEGRRVEKKKSELSSVVLLREQRAVDKLAPASQAAAVEPAESGPPAV